MLYSDLIMPNAQANLVTQVELYCRDQIYGTKDCSETLDSLLVQLLLMVGVTNPTCGATADMIQCFLSLLNQNNNC